MKLALNPPIIKFTKNGLKPWISHITELHASFSLPIKDVLLLSHNNMVIRFDPPIQYLYVPQYPEIIEALLDRCLEQVSLCVTYYAMTRFHTLCVRLCVF